MIHLNNQTNYLANINNVNSIGNRMNSNQNIQIENRKSIKLSGVTKIHNLNTLEFSLETTLGNLIIKGNNLEMLSFDVENGNLSITGEMDSLSYQNISKKNNKGFIQKLFK